MELAKLEESLHAEGEMDVAQPVQEPALPALSACVPVEEKEIERLEALLEQSRKSKLIEQVESTGL